MGKFHSFSTKCLVYWSINLFWSATTDNSRHLIHLFPRQCSQMHRIYSRIKELLIIFTQWHSNHSHNTRIDISYYIYFGRILITWLSSLRIFRLINFVFACTSLTWANAYAGDFELPEENFTCFWSIDMYHQRQCISRICCLLFIYSCFWSSCSSEMYRVTCYSHWIHESSMTCYCFRFFTRKKKRRIAKWSKQMKWSSTGIFL